MDTLCPACNAPLGTRPSWCRTCSKWIRAAIEGWCFPKEDVVMRSIFKYPIPITDHFSIDLSTGANVLSVQVQREMPCIWAAVDSDAKTTPTRFELRGTGHPLNGAEGRFVGTFQLASGGLVFHLFEAK